MSRIVKPYDLVRVFRTECGITCGSWGQVISQPWDDDQGNRIAKVRLVPDDPSTMIETSQFVTEPKADWPKWVQYAEVYGVGSFPVDMLRYDSCVPINFQIHEAELSWRGCPEIIHKSLDGEHTLWVYDGDNGDRNRLIVGRAVRTKSQPWTTRRWSSFLWGLKPLSTLKIKGE